MGEARTRVDWSKIEPQYRAGIRDVSDIAAEFRISDAAIHQHAKRHNWTRDLRGRIQAKADAKVARAMVTEREGSARKLTEAIRVEIEAEVQSRIRLGQRSGIEKLRKIADDLLEFLDSVTIGEDTIGRLVTLLAKLADTQRAIIEMECAAFGIEKNAEPAKPAEVNPMEAGRKIAFILARAAASMENAEGVVH